MDDTTGRTTPTPTPDAAAQLSLVRGSAHLMTAVPHLLGYRPGRSLVVVATAVQATARGPAGGPDTIRGRIVMTLRADLTGPGDVRPAVDQLASPVRRLQARYGDDLVLHCYLWDVDEALGVGAGRALRAFAGAVEVTINDLVLVGREAYLPLVAAGEPVDPRAGVSTGWLPLPSAADVPLIADLVLRGRGVAAGRDDAVAVLRHRDEEAARATDRAVTQLQEQEPEGFDGLAALGVLGHWVSGLVETVPTATERARAAIVLQDRMVRDVVLARWLPGLFTLDDLLEPAAAADLCELVPPWPQDDGGALARLINLAGQVPVDLSVPFVTLAGLLAWGTGEGTLANEAVDVALEIDPDYRMAQLLRQALDHALPPELLGTRSTDEGDGTDDEVDVEDGEVDGTDGEVDGTDGEVDATDDEADVKDGEGDGEGREGRDVRGRGRAA